MDTNFQEWSLDASVPVLEDDPDEASVKRVLLCLMPCKKYEIGREQGEHRAYWTFEWMDRVFNDDKVPSLRTYVVITAEQSGSESEHAVQLD